MKRRYAQTAHVFSVQADLATAIADQAGVTP
jgi:hypothetical protein